MSPVDLGGEEGWEPLMTPASGGTRSFVSGDPEGDRIRVRYFMRPGEEGIVGKAWFGPGTEGPPGHAHGGAMAAVLDEAMGACAWLAGHVCVAVELVVRFRKMLPLGSVARFDVRVVAVEGRKVRTSGRLVSLGGDLCCEADGVFVIVGAERLGRPGST